MGLWKEIQSVNDKQKSCVRYLWGKIIYLGIFLLLHTKLICSDAPAYIHTFIIFVPQPSKKLPNNTNFEEHQFKNQRKSSVESTV